MRDLAGEVAIVTGASRGVGRALAWSLASAGMEVVAFARSQEALDSLAAQIGAAGGNCLAVRGDVSKRPDVEALMEQVEARFGCLHVLINNAGLRSRLGITDVAIADWDRVLAVNLRGPFLCARAAVPLLRRTGGGHIINIGSVSGKQGYANRTAYCASKFGLQGLSQALAAEVKFAGIKVSVINPGNIATNVGGPKPPDPRIGLEDITETVLFLLRQSQHVWIPELTLWPFLDA